MNYSDLSRDYDDIISKNWKLESDIVNFISKYIQDGSRLSLGTWIDVTFDSGRIDYIDTLIKTKNSRIGIQTGLGCRYPLSAIEDFSKLKICEYLEDTYGIREG